MRALTIAVPLALLSIGCDAAVEVSPDGLASRAAPLAATARPAGPSRLYADRAAGVRFTHPAALRVVTDHWNAPLPPGKWRHQVTLSRDGTPTLRVEVWPENEGLGLDAWFDRHLAYSRVGATAVRPVGVGASALPAILVDQPRGQGPAQRLVTFALGERVVRVVCVDAEDATSRAVLDEVLATFDAEGAR